MKYKLLEHIPEDMQDIIKALNGIQATTTEWTGYEHKVRAQSGNTEIIDPNIVSFVEYNNLPIEGRTLDGHYEFFVNIKTLEFLVRQHSYYGGLTYTTPAKENGWKELNEADMHYVKATIAYKLLGMYFYDRDAMNSRGKNLFSTGEYEPPDKMFDCGRWIDGMKLSLLCDYKEYREESNNEPGKLGHLTEIDLKAIKILNNKN